MITIAKAVEKIIKKSLYMEEALAMGIVNLSALARHIKPDVERETMKKVQDGAVIVALNRLSRKNVKRTSLRIKRMFRNAPDMTVKSDLMEVTYANAASLALRQKKLLDRIGGGPGHFLTVTQGTNETTIIASRDLKEKILAIFKGERVIGRIENLSSVTVLLPTGTALVPGVYSYILKPLAWAGINVVEVVSTLNEFTIVLEDKNFEQAIAIIKRLF
jgi:hypothetical protein